MIASFSIVPVGAGEELKEEIARIVDFVDRSGLEYRLGAMSTTVEGGLEEVLRLIAECHRLARSRCRRVLTTITIDDREGAEGRITGKAADVEKILGRKLARG